MSFALLDTVVLERDLPEHRLCKGDVGTVVEVCSPDAIEVEFVTAGGQTQAVVSLHTAAVRPVHKRDLPAFRPLDPTD